MDHFTGKMEIVFVPQSGQNACIHHLYIQLPVNRHILPMPNISKNQPTLSANRKKKTIPPKLRGGASLFRCGAGVEATKTTGI